jgi:hypothetical protein
MTGLLVSYTFVTNISCLKLVEKPKPGILRENSNPYGIFTLNTGYDYLPKSENQYRSPDYREAS